MNKLIGFGIALITLVLSASVIALPDRVGDFGLMDSSGEFHQLSRYRNKEALVLMSFDSSCSAINSSVASLEAMASQWNDQGIAFALINSSAESNIEAIRSAKSALGSDLPLLLDDGQIVSETLSLTKAGEIVVLDPERLTILYRGPVTSAAATIV